MTGGSVRSKTADGLLIAQKWLDDHPSVKALLNNTSRIVGTAMWLKNFTPLGLLTGVVMEVGYTKVMKWVEEKTNAQENLSAYLLSIDGDLNKEQADALSSAAIQFMEGVGRVAMHGFSSKQLKKWEKGTKKLEMKDSKGLKGSIDKKKLPFNEGVLENFRKHAFKKERHSDLGISIEKMTSKGYDLIQRNSSLLKSGDNTLIANINGIQKSFKAFVHDGKVMSINMYPGISNRDTTGPIINLGDIKW